MLCTGNENGRRATIGKKNTFRLTNILNDPRQGANSGSLPVSLVLVNLLELGNITKNDLGSTLGMYFY